MQALGIDLGGTQIKAVLVDEAGTILRRELRPTGEQGATSFAPAVRELVDSFGHDAVVGLACPGLASANARSIAYMPGRLHGLEGLNWTTFLHRTSAVPVLNDGHASLLSEAWVGAARGLQHAVMLTLGTGVGGAILADGKILRGHIGRAGHFGHLCVDLDGPRTIANMPGGLETFCGNYNIAERTAGRFSTTHDLIAAYRSGDPDAATHWLRSIHALACGIGSLINVLDPEAVIIGGGIAAAGDALFSPLAEELAEVEWRPGGHAVKLLRAELGEWAGAIGAAREALLRMRDCRC